MPSELSYDTLPMHWVGNWLGPWARRYPQRSAILDSGSGRRFGYGELNDRANAVAHWLTDALGLDAGDRVCLLCRNRIEALDLYLACGKVGVILAPLSFRLRPRELNDLLARIAPRAFVHEAVFDALAEELTLPDGVQVHRVPEKGDGFGAVLDRQAPVEANREKALSDPYLYIHTGGTTGTPKICVIPYRQMVWNSLDLMVAGGGTRDARELITFPFFHIGGWNSLTPILHGGGFAVLLRQFDPGELLGLVSREKLRHFGGVEAMFRAIASSPDFNTADLSTLEGVTSAGAPCAASVMQTFLDRGIAITQAYGLTEAGPSNFINGAWDESLDDMRRQCASIGSNMPHCDFRLVDAQSGEPVSPGATGVLCMRSPHNFDGYLDDNVRTAQALSSEGWVWSGDLAVEGADGLVRIVGRADNMFITGGENVSPEEIEAVLASHPDVVQAGVTSVADERWGQVAVAAVVAGSSATADLASLLRDHCRDRLAGFKQPRELRCVEALPVTGAGKLDRAELRRMLADQN